MVNTVNYKVPSYFSNGTFHKLPVININQCEHKLQAVASPFKHGYLKMALKLIKKLRKPAITPSKKWLLLRPIIINPRIRPPITMESLWTANQRTSILCQSAQRIQSQSQWATPAVTAVVYYRAVKEQQRCRRWSRKRPNGNHQQRNSCNRF